MVGSADGGGRGVDLAGTHWQGGRRRGPAAQGLFWINSETQTQAGMTRVSDQNQW